MLLLGRGRKKLPNIDSSRILGPRLQTAQDKQRHHDRARPVGNLLDVKRKPLGQQHDFDGDEGHARHGT